MNDSKQLKPFRVEERPSPEPKPAAGAASNEEADPVHRAYPLIQALIDSERFEPLLKACEGSCEKLESSRTGGSEDEKKRARLGMAAYGRALDLLGELTTLKDEMSSSSGSLKKGARHVRTRNDTGPLL